MEAEIYRVSYNDFIDWTNRHKRWLRISRKEYDDESFTEHWVTENGLEVTITGDKNNILIAYIDIPDNLLETQTKKEIALQQQKQYEEEAKAQDSRIAVQEKSARADKQKDVIAATLEIGIKTDLAKARTAEAEGEATFRRQTSAAEGLGLAEGLKAQKDALGEQNTAMVTVMKYLADHNIPIVPQTLITSGGSGSGGLLDSFVGMLTAQKAKEFTPEKKS